MRICITGGAGYLGTVLLRQLLAHPLRFECVILDRLDHGAQPLLAVLTPEDAGRVEVCVADILDPPAHALRGLDAIIHLAGIVGYPACDANPQDADRTNVEGTRALCATATAARIPIVFASTGSCYGQRTTAEGDATEASRLSPLTRYGRTKAEGERAVLATPGGIVLRLATLFGLSPRMRWDLLPNDFCRAGVRGEIQMYEADARRTFLHVEDAARAFLLAVLGDLAPGVWNVGAADMNWSKRMLAAQVHALTDCRLGEMAGSDPDKRDYAVNYEKVRAAGFSPRYGLRASLPGLVQAARIWQ